MLRVNGSALFFDEDEIKHTKAFLPLLIRKIFYGLQITNDGFLNRYHRAFTELFPNKDKKDFGQNTASDRKHVRDRHKFTFKQLEKILMYMGYSIDSVSITIRDNVTNEVKTFSTNDSIEKLKEMIDKDHQVSKLNFFE